MRELLVIKLGTECVDKATGLKGTVTHWACDMGFGIDYLFQPKGLDDNGQPVKKLFLCEERLEVPEDSLEKVRVPVEILGTMVTDKASGFSGMAIELVRHINGCLHVGIQPQGVLPGKNTPIKPLDFDLRGCSGEKIAEMSKEEMEQSKKDAPSPTGDDFYGDRRDY